MRKLSEVEIDQYIANRDNLIKEMVSLKEYLNNEDFQNYDKHGTLNTQRAFMKEKVDNALNIALETDEDVTLADVSNINITDNFSKTEELVMNREILLGELWELQADFEDLSDEDIVDCLEVIENRVASCLNALLVTEEDVINIKSETLSTNIIDKKSNKNQEFDR